MNDGLRTSTLQQRSWGIAETRGQEPCQSSSCVIKGKISKERISEKEKLGVENIEIKGECFLTGDVGS